MQRKTSFILILVAIYSMLGFNTNIIAQTYEKRVNAAGSSYTTGGDTTFEADQEYTYGSWGYVGGNIYETTDPIYETDDDVLYQSERWDMTAYRFTVTNGDYQVVLHFAEIYYNQSGRRIFNVVIEGTTVLDDYDIFDEVGHDVAVQHSYAVNVSDGILDIEFSASSDAAKIFAIEVIETSSGNDPILSVSPTTLNFGTSQTSMTFTVSNSGGGTLNWSAAENPDETWITSVSPGSGSLNAGEEDIVTVTVDRTGLADGSYTGTISVTSNGGNQDVTVNMTVSSQADYVQRVNTGGSSYTTGGSVTFDADQAYSSGGWGYVEGNVYSTSDPIDETNDDILYQTERWGMSAYRFTVDDGTYQVILHFAEIYLNYTGGRIFDVTLEGTTVLDDYDIYADVGHDVAVQHTFYVDVSDGILDIEFSASVDDPKVSAIEVIETIVGDPVLSVDPTVIDFGNSYTSKTFSITNSGEGTQNWSAAENPDESWITSISPASGSLNAGEQDIVTVNISRDGLADGDYSGTITVTSNGGDQDVTVNMTVESIPLTLLSLNGFEELPPGSSQEIRWMGADTAAYLSLKYSLDNGSNWTTITDSAINCGFYVWETPEVTSDNCLINIYCAQEEDSNDNLFKITEEPRIRITYPNGGEWWRQTETHPIDWITNIFNGMVRIEYSSNNGQNWVEIIGSYPSSNGTYNWTLPELLPPSSDYIIRISDASDGNPFDVSDATFGVAASVYGRWHEEIQFRPRVLYTQAEETAIRNRLTGTDVYHHLWNNTTYRSRTGSSLPGIFQRANLDPDGRPDFSTDTDEAQIAKCAAFVYAMNIDESGNALTNRDYYLNKTVDLLQNLDTRAWNGYDRPINKKPSMIAKLISWFCRKLLKMPISASKFEKGLWLEERKDYIGHLQWRSKELIQYCEAYDLLLGAGYSRNEDIEFQIQKFASNIYYLADSACEFGFPARNNNRLMVAAALGVAAVTINDCGTMDDIDENNGTEENRTIASNQPYHWAKWAFEQTHYVLKSICTDEVDRVYTEGPYYYRYAMMHNLPCFKAIRNFIGDTYEFGKRSPWYDEDYIQTHDWITKIKMPDGRLPAFCDSYQDRYFPELAIRADSEHPYYSWPILPTENLTGQASPSPIEEEAAMLNFQLITGRYDTRIDYICAGNAPQQVPSDWNPSQVFSTGGDVVLRSGWSENDTYLYINARDKDPDVLFSGHHRQNDQHSFILNYKGTNLALDAGYISYGERHKVNNDYNHNSLLIDDQGPKFDETKTLVEKSYLHDDFSYVQISSDFEDDGEKDAFREFVMINNSYYLVGDDFSNSGTSAKNYKLLIHGNDADNFSSGIQNGGLWQTTSFELKSQTFSQNSINTTYTMGTSQEEITIYGNGYGMDPEYKTVIKCEVNAVETEFETILYPADINSSAQFYISEDTDYKGIFVDDRSRTNRYEFCLVNHTPGDINFYQEAFTPDDIIIHSIHTDADLLIMSFDENTREIKDCNVFVKGATFLRYRGVPFIIPSTEPQVLPQPQIVNSNISADETWSAMKYISGNITVEPGVTLTINEDVGILFADNAQLTIQGNVQAIGSSNKRIVFSSGAYQPGSGDWSGIRFDNSQSNCDMEYCTIEYAIMGINCIQSSPSLRYNNIEYCSQTGIELNESEPYIEGGYISDCFVGLKATDSYDNDFMSIHIDGVPFLYCNYGIFLYHSSPTIRNCNSVANQWGLFCQHSSLPTLDNNFFQYNYYDGIRSVDDSAPYVYVVNSSYYGGYNTITNNDQHGISAYNSMPRIGYNQDMYPGNNSIYDNVGYEVRIDPGSETQLVWAVYNYWNGQQADTTGDVRVEPVRSNPPASQAMAKYAVVDSSRLALRNKFVSQPDSFLTNSVMQPSQNVEAEIHFEKGYQHQLKQEYANATAEYNYVISSYPESKYARLSLVQMIYCYEEQNQKQNILTYLDGIATSYKDQYLGYHAQSLKVPYLKKNEKFQDAISICADLANEGRFNNERAKLNLLFQMGYIHKYNLKNKQQANAAFSQLIASYPEDILAVFAENELDSSSTGMLLSKKTPEKSVEETQIPEAFSLAQNYPNPFNAGTVITYKLPQSVHVTLEIYNVMGQKVRTLVDEQQAAGQYHVNWDSRNDEGQLVLSGIYVYKIIAGGFKNTRKMIIIH